MTDDAVVSKPLSLKLLQVVFSIYFLVAITITSIHIYISYDDAKDHINNELQSIESAFGPAFQTAIWELNDEQLSTIALGILKLDYVRGMTIVDGKGITLFESADVQENNFNSSFYHQFSILKQSVDNTFKLADIRLYSSSEVVIDRIFVGVVVLVINAIIKTIILWWLLLWAFKKYIFKPLNTFTAALQNIDLNNADNKQINLEINDDNELKLIEASFNTMTQTIDSQKNELMIKNEEIVDEKQKRIDMEVNYSSELQSDVEKRTKELTELNKKLNHLASTDDLTQIHNRRSFFEISEKISSVANRVGDDLSLLMCDIDHFKNINDEYGHDVGDVALRHFTSSVSELLRDSDVFARMGGEEFAILLYNTNRDGALMMAERIRKKISFTPVVVGGKSIPMTVSIGFTAKLSNSSTIEELLSKADKALYKAKKAGRDKCFVGE